MQSEEISLEESFQAYKEGMEYVRFCNETIDQIEKKVLVLNQEGQWDELEE
jgi:exodeoxyribonuclease VII small subunit